MVKLSASINPCIESQAVEYSKELQIAGTDYLHLDVMRSNFVPNNMLNINTIFEIADNTLLPLDCHLMVNEPLSILPEYLKLKLNYITVHYEAFSNKQDMLKAFKMIRDTHSLAGISIKPNTFVKEIVEYLPYVDMVVIMGVEPGFSGQKMISNTIPKVKELHDIIVKEGYNIKIEVDGGVNEKNMKELYKAGADILVMGSRLFNAPNKTNFIKEVHAVK